MNQKNSKVCGQCKKPSVRDVRRTKVYKGIVIENIPTTYYLSFVLFFILITIFNLDSQAQRRRAPAGAAPPSAQYEGLPVETGDNELSTAQPDTGGWRALAAYTMLKLTLKVREDYVIKLDDAYKKRFEK